MALSLLWKLVRQSSQELPLHHLLSEMDFISLAEASNALIRHLSSADDDFANLDVTSNHAEPAQPLSQMAESSHKVTFSPDDLSVEQRPLLSPSAEKELFLLASNFLLCEYRVPGVVFFFRNGPHHFLYN